MDSVPLPTGLWQMPRVLCVVFKKGMVLGNVWAAVILFQFIEKWNGFPVRFRHC